jgi:hypothetical protein
MVRTGLKKFARLSSQSLGITLARMLKDEIKPAPPRRHHSRFCIYQFRIATSSKKAVLHDVRI